MIAQTTMHATARHYPVVVFAYQRPEHLRHTLDALAACAGAAQTDVFVFCDGTRSEADRAVCERAQAVARTERGFGSLTVSVASSNRGLGAAVISGVTEVLSDHEAVIVVEDDIEVAVGFLIFMNAALTRYRDVASVFSVAGYTPPVPGRDALGDAFFVPRICSWGWATWRDRWMSVDWHASAYPAFICDTRRRAAFSRAGTDMLDMLINQIEGRAESWAIRFDFGRYLHGDALTVYPARSLVSNSGADGSGEHGEVSLRYTTELSNRIAFELPSQVVEHTVLTRAFARFYPRRWRSRLAIHARRLHLHGPARRLFRLFVR